MKIQNMVMMHIKKGITKGIYFQSILSRNKGQGAQNLADFEVAR